MGSRMGSTPLESVVLLPVVAITIIRRAKFQALSLFPRHFLIMSASLKRKSGEASSDQYKMKKPNIRGHWSLGLLASMEDPELRVEADDKVVIINDKYPKAKYHFLVLPKEKLSNLKSVNSEHIQLLKHMQKKGEEIAEKSDSNLQFRYGYHAIPSMGQLHLHVISQDFNSPCLKNKKHWNSFVSEYFIDSTDIIKQLEEKGKIEIDNSKNEELLKRNLRCHVCKAAQSNMPTLKTHIATHNYNKKK